MRFITFIFLSIISFSLLGQIVVLQPVNAGPDDAATIVFDANAGNKELKGANKVYMHHGVVTDKVNGTAWKYVKGNWGADDGIGEMTKVSGETDKWQMTFSPNIRSYFNVPAGENIFRISAVFRSADGSKKGTIAPGEYGWGTVTSNSDIYINLNNDNYIGITQPSGNEGFVDAGQSVNISGVASSNVTEMKIWLDEGNGYIEKAFVNTGKTISYNYKPNSSIEVKIKISAIIGGIQFEALKTYNVIINQPTEIAALPQGLVQGVNYNITDPTKATLVLLAPFKNFVFAVGDFSDWKTKSENQMKRTPDGQYYWLELNNLSPQIDYVYQYWIDGKLKLADPYARQIADPWNDKWIESTVFPNLPVYDRQDLGIASVLKTGKVAYQWSAIETQWSKPDVNHLVIYELHIRDFLASHAYADLIDTISYLKRLGINAIELMPINEFEGNDSWGYNPSFYFATDKYYGTEEQLKKFIEVAHQNGIAVILDMVLNHSFGQGPMVQMYFEGGKPAANNPWFNREYVGQYQWGYDFNHESQYTKDFVDDVNRFWLEEFHFDGFRFDFTKGFTNYAPGGSVDGFDQSRINILKRMADKIWSVDQQAYVILEHWSPDAEENILGSYGMKMWRNKSYDFVPATVADTRGSFANADATTHVTFYDSHDERRIAEHCVAEGRSAGSYNIKDTVIMYERVKMAAAFNFLQPGPKMIWQFDELGYDVNIDFNGRIGRKPYAWGDGSLKYYENPLRQNIYKAYEGILNVRNIIGPELLKASQKSHQQTGDVRRLSFNTTGIDLVVIGNYSLAKKGIDPKFSQIGKWYNYFSGDSIIVGNVNEIINLQPGEWHIYTTKRLADGQPDVVAVFDNPITILPNPFKGSDLISIRFDARKASKSSTQGLIGAQKVYLHSGVILNNSIGKNLTNVVGNGIDDGIGQMTKVGEETWEIKITPNVYYNLTQSQEIYQIGMWCRNEDNTKKGYGFRDAIMYFDVLSDLPIVTIDPPKFDANTEITITFNARIGNRELVGADKVYMHAGVVTNNTISPKGTDWNKVVGNWGLDDGIGRMTKVVGQQDIWQIKLKPKDYFGMANADFPYWIAAVFRNSGGTAKGTIAAGNYDFGLVDAGSQDFFIKNASTVASDDMIVEKVKVFPNPSSGKLYFKGLSNVEKVTITDLKGNVKISTMLSNYSSVDISDFQSGIYIFVVEGRNIQGKIIKM